MNLRGRAKAKAKVKVKVKQKEKEKTRKEQAVQAATLVAATTWPAIARREKARARVRILGRQDAIRPEDQRARVKALGYLPCIAKTCISSVNVKTEVVPLHTLAKKRSNS